MAVVYILENLEGVPMRLLLLWAFATLVVASLSYNVSVFKRGRSLVRHRTVLELRALLKERLRVRKLEFNVKKKN